MDFSKLRITDDDEEDSKEVPPTDILQLRTKKYYVLSKYSFEVKRRVNLIIDELVCATIFNVHKQLKLGILDPSLIDPNYKRRGLSPALTQLAESLNITKPTQEVECPKCYIPVKCLLLSKHLALCMNPHQSTYSYSSRNSSRIARQRIQEGFKTTSDESKNDSDDERAKPKKRINKGKKSAVKSLK